MRLGIILRRYRQMHDIQAKDMAAEIGLAPSTLSRIESGRTVHVETIGLLLRWLFAEVPTGRAKQTALPLQPAADAPPLTEDHDEATGTTDHAGTPAL